MCHSIILQVLHKPFLIRYQSHNRIQLTMRSLIIIIPLIFTILFDIGTAKGFRAIKNKAAGKIEKIKGMKREY